MSKYPYKLPNLGYEFDALEPYIDSNTMEIHYTKHHKSYIEKLNQALASYPDLQNFTLDYLLTNLQTVPENIRRDVRNQGGGTLNHTFFWPLLSKRYAQGPKGELKNLIEKFFGSYEQFKEQFSTAAKSVFGSGWAWASLDEDDKLVITTTHNQDNPISQKLRPILGLDVWEHAYYLKYQNKRVDYIDAWWHVVNWLQVEDNYTKVR